jgi:hypothetical protein
VLGRRLLADHHARYVEPVEGPNPGTHSFKGDGLEILGLGFRCSRLFSLFGSWCLWAALPSEETGVIFSAELIYVFSPEDVDIGQHCGRYGSKNDCVSREVAIGNACSLCRLFHCQDFGFVLGIDNHKFQSLRRRIAGQSSDYGRNPSENGKITYL